MDSRRVLLQASAGFREPSFKSMVIPSPRFLTHDNYARLGRALLLPRLYSGPAHRATPRGPRKGLAALDRAVTCPGATSPNGYPGRIFTAETARLPALLQRWSTDTKGVGPEAFSRLSGAGCLSGRDSGAVLPHTLWLRCRRWSLLSAPIRSGGSGDRSPLPGDRCRWVERTP